MKSKHGSGRQKQRLVLQTKQVTGTKSQKEKKKDRLIYTTNREQVCKQGR